MGSSSPKRGRAKVALASLIVSLIISAQRTGHGPDYEEPDGTSTGVVLLLTGFPRILQNIAKLITFVTAAAELCDSHRGAECT
jgi:hypothetical protein